MKLEIDGLPCGMVQRFGVVLTKGFDGKCNRSYRDGFFTRCEAETFARLESETYSGLEFAVVVYPMHATTDVEKREAELWQRIQRMKDREELIRRGINPDVRIVCIEE